MFLGEILGETKNKKKAKILTQNQTPKTKQIKSNPKQNKTKQKHDQRPYLHRRQI